MIYFQRKLDYVSLHKWAWNLETNALFLNDTPRHTIQSSSWNDRRHDPHTYYKDLSGAFLPHSLCGLHRDDLVHHLRQHLKTGKCLFALP